MNIWLIIGWESNYGNWEVLGVVFTPEAVEQKVESIKADCPEYSTIKVETWYRDRDEDEASFYSDDVVYNSEDE